jgi:hypothetical protein
LAWRVLSGRLGRLFVTLPFIALSGCRRDEQRAAPTVSASVSAAAESYAAGARAANFGAELRRAEARWSEKPSLGECAAILHEKSDVELCQAASRALGALEEQPAPERALPALESAALSLARLTERARFLSLSELSNKRITRDAGAPAAPAASHAVHVPRPKAPFDQLDVGRRGTFELGQGPSSGLLTRSLRLERDVLRNLGAFLEYAELPVRRSAFEAVKRLYAQHQPWALLAQLLREASLLESDPALKSELSMLALRAQPPSDLVPAHSADSK